MSNIAKYISYSRNEDTSTELLEERGFRIYDTGHGSFYYVAPTAPEEADFLASSAAQGDSDAEKAILNY